MLAVLLDHDDIYVSTYYLFRRDALGKERPTALASIKAHAEAIKRFYDDKDFAAKTMIKYGGTRDRRRRQSSLRLYFAKARVLEAMPYALKGSIDAVIERQGQELKGADFSKMIDNSLVDQLVKEKYFEDCLRRRPFVTNSSAGRRKPLAANSFSPALTVKRRYRLGLFCA